MNLARLKSTDSVADKIDAQLKNPRKDPGPRPISLQIINKVLATCNLAFENPKGEVFVSSTPSAARSFRQTIYEVRRYLRPKQGSEEYRALFESHIKLVGNELHIGPHPMLFNEDFALKKADGSLVPLSEALQHSFTSRKVNVDDPEVELPFSYMDRFLLAALVQQSIVEICKERGIDPAQMALAKIMPLARKRGTKYFSEGVLPDKELPEIEAFYDVYSEAYQFALFKQSQGE